MPGVTGQEIEATVQEIIRGHGVSSPITPDAVLGSDGLGLDSVAIAEVLMDCESRFGVELTDLLSDTPLTVGGLTDALAARTAGSTSS